MKVGKKIGCPIRMDDNTLRRSRGRFSQLCVEVDLAKPLLSKFWLRHRIRRLEYEGLHQFVFRVAIKGIEVMIVCKMEWRGTEVGSLVDLSCEEGVN